LNPAECDIGGRPPARAGATFFGRALFFVTNPPPAVFSAHQPNPENMKTLPSLAFLAAFVAFFVLPLPFEIAGSVLIAAALGAVFLSDYARTRRLQRVYTAPVVARPARERLRLAA
jgi:hypothetical protein